MGFWSSVCSFAKAAVSCVLGGFSSLAINAVSSVCPFIVKFLGVMKEKDNLEDLGERSLQAEESGIRPENYQKFEDYQKAIDNFEIDPKKKHRPEDCLNRGIDHVNLASKMKMPELNLEAVINYLGKVDGEGNAIYQFNVEKGHHKENIMRINELSDFFEIVDRIDEANHIGMGEWGKAKYNNGTMVVIAKAKIKLTRE